MIPLRNWRLGLALSALVLGSVGTANAGYLGDSITVSLTVHTTGAIDQDVWSSTPAVVVPGSILGGDSWPNGVSAPLLWELVGLGADPDCFLLSVLNPNAVATTVDPLLLVITGLDAMPVGGVVLGGINTMGVLPSDLSYTGSSVTISSLILAPLAPGGSLAVEFCIVPEVSSLAMMAFAVSGIAGGVFWRRRRMA
jgi:hypothetical protein